MQFRLFQFCMEKMCEAIIYQVPQIGAKMAPIKMRLIANNNLIFKRYFLMNANFVNKVKTDKFYIQYMRNIDTAHSIIERLFAFEKFKLNLFLYFKGNLYGSMCRL